MLNKPSTKRKLQDALESVTSTSSKTFKKRKITVSNGLKNAVSAIKASTVQKAMAAKQMADRSSRQIKRAKTKRTNVIFRPRTASAVADSASVDVVRRKRGRPRKDSSATGTTAPAATSRGRGRPKSSGTMKKGVVRTMKGRAGGQGRTIRVISD